jgi:hypothetical protein
MTKKEESFFERFFCRKKPSFVNFLDCFVALANNADHLIDKIPENKGRK